MLTDVLRRVRDASTDLGWRGVLRTAPRWLVCRRYLGLAADLRTLSLERRAHPEIRVTLLADSDMAAVRTLDPSMTPDEVARRLDEGQQCTLGWWGRELAHYRWDATGAVYLPYLGRTLRPGPGDQVVVGIYTGLAYRGRGVAGATMIEASRRAVAERVSRLVWLAAWWNARSLGLADQFASRVVGTVGYWALGRYRRYFATGDVWLDADGSVRIGSVRAVPGGARSRLSAARRG